ncbi:hypothetical protein HK101_006097 [Irineochytrium annulatum]|nr:hypothetical protein HK101_006097 [Irineochytrium annulatum]
MAIGFGRTTASNKHDASQATSQAEDDVEEVVVIEESDDEEEIGGQGAHEDEDDEEDEEDSDDDALAEQLRRNTLMNAMVDLDVLQSARPVATSAISRPVIAPSTAAARRAPKLPPISAANQRMVDFWSDRCPGVQGPGTVTDVHLWSLGRLFAELGRLEVPIMQRRYAWGGELLDTWWNDCVAGAKAAAAGSKATGVASKGHRIGKCMVRRKALDADVEDVDSLDVLVIDGQQRLTTTMLLLAAIRDALLAHLTSANLSATERAATTSTVARLQSIIFIHPPPTPTDAQFRATLTTMIPGQVHPSSRLIPSHPDRLPYALHVLASPPIPATTQTPLSVARAQFDALARPLTPALLRGVADATLTRFHLTVLDARTPDLDLPRVFQWLQERSILSLGSELFKVAPNEGRLFGAIDLVRNLFVSRFIRSGSSELQARYEGWWVPFERRFDGMGVEVFHAFLGRFVETEGGRGAGEEKTRLQDHVGRMEETLAKKKGWEGKVGLDGIKVYADFEAVYERKVKEGMEPSEVMQQLMDFV